MPAKANAEANISPDSLFFMPVFLVGGEGADRLTDELRVIEAGFFTTKDQDQGTFSALKSQYAAQASR
jgi:hypothetical protein